MSLVDDYLIGVVLFSHMQLFSRHRTIVLYILLAAVAIGASVWYYSTRIYVPAFPINTADAISSWDFQGAYTGNATLIGKANADISHLSGLLGTGQYDDYDLYNGMANDYGLMGDGKDAYAYYNRSINVHTDKGLAYVNLAHLLESLGAYHTAADAYARAVSAEPTVLEYHIERLTFLTEQFASDNALVTAALATASKQFGDSPSILAIEAQWLSGQKRYADAIKAWQTVKMLSPQNRQASIDTEIARLKAKQ
jgi:tetratricopeptide (TPR) repeat protein